MSWLTAQAVAQRRPRSRVLGVSAEVALAHAVGLATRQVVIVQVVVQDGRPVTVGVMTGMSVPLHPRRRNIAVVFHSVIQ